MYVFMLILMTLCCSACATTITPHDHPSLVTELEELRNAFEDLQILSNHEHLALDYFLRRKEGKGNGVYVDYPSSVTMEKLTSIKVPRDMIVTIAVRPRHELRYCVWYIHLWSVSRYGVILLLDRLKIEEGARSESCNYAQEKFEGWNFSNRVIDPFVETPSILRGVNDPPVVR